MHYRTSLQPACEALTALVTLTRTGDPLEARHAVELTQTLLRTVHVPSFAAPERLAALNLLHALLQVHVWSMLMCGQR